MKKLNTILFDLDGTLINTNQIILESYKHSFQTHMPSSLPDESDIFNLIGAPLRDVFARYTSNASEVNAMIETYLSFYEAHEHQYFYFYEGIETMLQTLKQQGYNLAIVTTKYLSSAQPSIEHFGLKRFFDVIVTLEDTEHAKPDKAPVLHALKQFKHVEKSIMIGDNTWDIMAGNNAGILSAGVAWSIKGEEKLLEANPDYMLKHPSDIFKIIDKVSQGEDE